MRLPCLDPLTQGHTYSNVWAAKAIIPAVASPRVAQGRSLNWLTLTE
jgi:hypothetical protein